MKHRNKRGHLPALSHERKRALVRLYFKRRVKQVTLAIQFRIAQSTVAKYIANG